MRSPVVPVVVAALLAGVLLPSCGTGGGTAGGGPVAARPAEGVDRLRVRVLGTLPHDADAFTQGLEVAGGTLYESTGRVGGSSVRAGPVGGDPEVRVALPAPLFGEGITVLGATLWQLTWRDGVAVQRDARTLAELRRVPYRGEGWGVCHQPEHDRLVTSDGSSRLAFRDPASLAVTGGVAVTAAGRPVGRLNELECVGDTVYANVWPTDRIVRVDAGTGAVTGEVDAAGLLTARQERRAGVLNGIAALPGADRFLLTGKLWPRMFRVAFVPAEPPERSPRPGRAFRDARPEAVLRRRSPPRAAGTGPLTTCRRRGARRGHAAPFRAAAC